MGKRGNVSPWSVSPKNNWRCAGLRAVHCAEVSHLCAVCGMLDCGVKGEAEKWMEVGSTLAGLVHVRIEHITE